MDGLSLFVNVQPYGRLLYGLIGVTWAFHFTFTCWMIPKNQTRPDAIRERFFPSS